MRPRCGVCGAKTLSGDVSCLSCASWRRRQAAGSAPEFSAPKREGGLERKLRPIASPPSKGHPSMRPARLRAVNPCYCHNQPDALECEGCIRNGELDREAFAWVPGADL
jgi:hypothetical protein